MPENKGSQARRRIIFGGNNAVVQTIFSISTALSGFNRSERTESSLIPIIIARRIGTCSGLVEMLAKRKLPELVDQPGEPYISLEFIRIQGLLFYASKKNYEYATEEKGLIRQVISLFC